MDDLRTSLAVAAEKIKSLENDRDILWVTVTKLEEKLNKISNQLSAFGVVNTLTLAWIAYRLTRN